MGKRRKTNQAEEQGQDSTLQKELNDKGACRGAASNADTLHKDQLNHQEACGSAASMQADTLHKDQLNHQETCGNAADMYADNSHKEQFKDQKTRTRTGHTFRAFLVRIVARLVLCATACKKYIGKMRAAAGKGQNSGSSSGNTVFPLIFFIGSVVYLEVLFHILIYRGMDAKIIYPILFSIPCGIMLTVFTGLFQGKTGRIVYRLLMGIFCLIFEVQLVYYHVFKVYFSFQSLGLAEDAFSNFFTEIIKAIAANAVGIILLLFPLAVLAFFMKGRVPYQRRGRKHQCFLLGGLAGFHLIAVAALLLFGREDYSPYDLYFHTSVPELSGEQLGVVTMTRLDLDGLLDNTNDLALVETMKTNSSISAATATTVPASGTALTQSSALFPSASAGSAVSQPSQSQAGTSASGQEQADASSPAQAGALTVMPTQTPTPTPMDTSPNSMNIDFDALAAQEKKEAIRTLHQYFASVTPTNKNQYTGMFKGYNLIMLTAEGFSPYAVDKAKTPTLYKLLQEGFVFNQFYTPLWQTSTSDGEYVAMTGLIPVGTRSMFRGRGNLWPFSLGNQFNLLGVESKAYHDHTYTYYQRDETHPNLGYLFKAKGNGLKLPTDCWPESDLEMMEATVGEYIEEKQFHVYYMTVSGHMNYTFTGNSMAYKNRALVEDLSYSEDAKAYIACQIELDKALEYLVNALEKAGVADKTVIALSADHYPYGWEKDTIDEIAGHEVDPDFEIYRNHFILWCEGMREKVVIDEPCSSLDILPTLSNLFGLEYDSRLLMGQDILSDAEPLVILNNRSFITDKVMYNSANGETTLLTEEPLPEDYISGLNKIVKNKFSVSQSVLKEDYYRYVFPENRK